MKIETVVGNATGGRWSQVHSSSGGKGRELVVVVDLTGAELMDLPMYGAEIIKAAEEKYHTTTLCKLDDVKQIQERAKKEVVEGISASILISVFEGNLIYVVGEGEVGVRLRRKGALHEIFTGTASSTAISGKVLPGDIVVFGTRGFFGAVEGKLIDAVESGSASEVLAPLVLGKDESADVAGIVVKDFSLETEGVIESEESAGIARAARNLKGFFAGMRSGLPRQLKVKRDRPNRNNLLGVLIFGALVVSVLIGVWKRGAVVAERRFGELEQAVTQQLTEASAVADLNPERARYLINQAKEGVEKYLVETKDQKYLTRAQELEGRVREVEERALKKSEVEVNPFVDLAVLKGEISARNMYLVEGNLYLYDEKSGSALGINLEDRSSIGGVTLGAAADFAYYEGRFILDQDGSVVAVDQKTGEKESVIEKDESWGRIGFVEVFAGNIYLIDTGAGEVWKYPVLDEGWGARRRWFGQGIVLDLSNVIDVAIDGDIWLLTSTGKLERYSRGAPADFSFDGFPAVSTPGRLVDPGAVYVTEEGVYVLERGGGRVVAFDLSGRFLKQYVSEKFAGARDMVVFEGQAYLLTETQILQFGL